MKAIEVQIVKCDDSWMWIVDGDQLGWGGELLCTNYYGIRSMCAREAEMVMGELGRKVIFVDPDDDAIRQARRFS